MTRTVKAQRVPFDLVAQRYVDVLRDHDGVVPHLADVLQRSLS